MLIKFLLSSELWSNILGGVTAAIIFAVITFLWNRRKHKILKDLIDIMGDAIQHRNAGEQGAFSSEEEWINEAKQIEAKAISKAKKLSTTAGALVEWLDRIEPWRTDSEFEKHISILSKVIERIRELMKRNT